ncbi:hypothetical protein FOZ61_003334 [Perkinsus olseni]|uniref:Uncharacterized protein n=1 Tax=Perkinsus olseni TaxID=32597 RepID=A0A7J6LQI0_PEROL|nr:hypothetical protein FOZ61_003334 [Perkinsus olseni]KAF4666626.1 hypothetical protein FOL46_002995 [Perkinsus olseni]
MVLSKSFVAKTFRCLGLSCLLANPTWAQVVREKELLYGRVRSGTEFFFIPHEGTAVVTVADSRHRGLTKHKKVFREKARSPRKTKADIKTFDFIPFNSLNDEHEKVTHARILRLKDGETKEYKANVGKGKCFENVMSCESTFGCDKGDASKEASKSVKEELTEVCEQGLTALKPSPSLSKLNGTYTGRRMGRKLELQFSGGVIEDVDLVVKHDFGKARIVTYYPVCNGVMSLVNGGDAETEDLVTLMILKKSTGEEKSGFGAWLSAWSGKEDEEPLCNVEEHGRRNITRSTLFTWDHILPLNFNLKPKVKRD